MDLEKWIRERMNDIQIGGDKYYWDMYRDFPEDMKGTSAQRLWKYDKDYKGFHPHYEFTYGSEYGALIILHELRKFLVSTKTSEENNKYCVGWIPNEDKTFDSDIVTDETYDAFSEIEKETE